MIDDSLDVLYGVVKEVETLLGRYLVGLGP